MLTRVSQSIHLLCSRRDGSGSITYDEFQKWWRTDNRFQNLQLSEDEMAVLTRCADYFKHFDRDHSGCLNAEEFRCVLRVRRRVRVCVSRACAWRLTLAERSRRHTHADLAKHGLTTKTFDQCFSELDSDGSGHITYNEYIQWLIRIGSLKLKPID